VPEMMPASRLILRLAALVLPLAVASAAAAAPTSVSLTPPEGARFLEGQRFDIRVEGKGTGPFRAALTLDGAPLPITSGGQNTTGTDGISSPGWGGFNVRGFSTSAAGHHTLRATFTDQTGSTTVQSSFEIVDVGGRGLVKNVIIMLGDGMGVSHRTAARIVKFGVTAGQPDGFLAMDRFPGTGLVTTHSLNSIVTDSAPGMACYVSGAHNRNGQEGVYPANVTNPFYFPRVEYLSEYLHRLRGTSLGIVSTADLEDATPAANAVHTGNRGAGQGIVDQYLDESRNTGLRVLLGGGRRWFLPAGVFGSSRTIGNDYGSLPADLQAAWGAPAGLIDPARNLVGDFQAAGFSYVATGTELSAALGGHDPAKLLGLFGYGNMNVAADKIAKRRDLGGPYVVDDYHAPDQPMLDEMTDAALRVLSRDRDGFVLMVEGAHIDKQSHLMDADRVIGETIEFDNAVGVARRFAERREDTLVLVLADHECSGFSLIGALVGGVANLEALPSDASVLDPATAPSRQKAVGTYDAAVFPRYEIEADGYPKSFDVDGKVLVGYGASGDRYETWLSKEKPVIDSLLSNDIKSELAGNGYVDAPWKRTEDAEGFFLRGQAVGRDQAVHTAADIPVSAYSRSDAWRACVGVQTNTDIFFKIGKLVLGPGRRYDASIERWSEMRLALPGR
jgi:alkaline phosphatase